MQKYNVTVEAHHEKQITVYANTVEEAGSIVQTILNSTDLIQFEKEDISYGRATINEELEQENGEQEPYVCEESCSECIFRCQTCGGCLVEGEE